METPTFLSLVLFDRVGVAVSVLLGATRDNADMASAASIASAEG